MKQPVLVWVFCSGGMLYLEAKFWWGLVTFGGACSGALSLLVAVVSVPTRTLMIFDC